MKMTFEEFDAAGDAYVENPNLPMPLPCATETCVDEVLEYSNGIYRCPVCGRTVKKSYAIQYLHDIANRK